MDSQKRSKEVLGCVAANSNRMQHSVLSAIESERSRLYQLEMYDASMERNTVVVVYLYIVHCGHFSNMRNTDDTGSGKTHV